MKLQDAITRTHLLMTRKLNWDTDNAANRQALRVLLTKVRRQSGMRQIPDVDVDLLREALKAAKLAYIMPERKYMAAHLDVACDRMRRVLADAETNGVASLGSCRTVSPYSARKSARDDNHTDVSDDGSTTA